MKMNKQLKLIDIIRKGIDIGYSAETTLHIYNGIQDVTYKGSGVINDEKLNQLSMTNMIDYLKRVDDIATIGQWRHNTSSLPNYNREVALKVGERFNSLYGSNISSQLNNNKQVYSGKRGK